MSVGPISQDEITPKPKPGGALAPLKEPAFRGIWIASIFSNFGMLILGVGAAWEMTRLTTNPEMVALVQSAMMLPSMLVGVPSGALADLFDRRKVALTGLFIAMAFAITLTTLAALGFTTPWMLLAFCVLIGVGTSIYGPAWQASIPEQVKQEDVPAAIALGSVSFNVARSFGPAVGGAIVLAAGATAAFGLNAACYIPLIIALFLWNNRRNTHDHLRERMDRAIVSGARYVRHSPPVRLVVFRAFVTGACTASVSALTPLMARDMLHGDASTYGLLLGAYGVGAVGGAFVLGRLLSRWPPESALRACAILGGVSLLLISIAHNLFAMLVLLAATGMLWMLNAAILNIGVQLSTPRWVTARALAWYQSALTGGVAIGAWFWGYLTGVYNLEIAIALSGAAMIVTMLIGLVLPIRPIDTSLVEEVAATPLRELQAELPLTLRSGPISLEIDYRVAPAQVDEFLAVMQEVQSSRMRMGAFDWTLERDIGDPQLWTERYYYPTWGDYLRQRTRFTEGDHQLYRRSIAFRTGPDSDVRRRLERPPGASGREQGPIGIFTP